MATTLLAGFSPGSLRNAFLGVVADWLRGHWVWGVSPTPNQLADGLHGVLYGGFGFCLYLGFGYRWRLMVGACGFAVATEFLQRWVPERTPSLTDAAINVAALAGGVVLGLVWERLRLGQMAKQGGPVG